MIAFVVKLAFQAVELVIVVGIILHMVSQVTRGPWTRHPFIKTVMLAARLICAPVRQILKGAGIPVAPIDFSPLLTILALRVLQWAVVGFLRIFP
ncbi:MAG: hypothetical protein K0Q72_77 [Armatimonadetes bacterium]|jgi:uncharacterized protein YggT (Ycf19 family)|nr:hypothetical protein [Armatimonadota bacterium]